MPWPLPPRTLANSLRRCPEQHTYICALPLRALPSRCTAQLLLPMSLPTARFMCAQASSPLGAVALLWGPLLGLHVAKVAESVSTEAYDTTLVSFVLSIALHTHTEGCQTPSLGTAWSDGCRRSKWTANLHHMHLSLCISASHTVCIICISAHASQRMHLSKWSTPCASYASQQVVHTVCIICISASGPHRLKLGALNPSLPSHAARPGGCGGCWRGAIPGCDSRDGSRRSRGGQ